MQRKEESDKRLIEGRRFVKISTESIKSIAEASGLSGLNEEITNKISDDVTYRLREAIYHASVFLRHSKRRKLLISDIQEVFEDFDVPKIYGHSGSEPSDLVYVNEADVFVNNDGEELIETLAFDSSPLIQLGDPVICDTDVSPSEEMAEVEPAPTQVTVKQEVDDLTTSSTIIANQETNQNQHIPVHLLSYYNRAATILLGSSKVHLEVILNDFLVNNKIGLLVPYFLNLISMGLHKIPEMRLRLIHAVLVISYNKCIELNSNLAVHNLVSALLMCALENKDPDDSAADSDYLVRSDAALVLTRVMSQWCTGNTKLMLEVVQKLGSVLLNGSSPLNSHYGALACLVSLGSDALEYCLWPHLSDYLSFLSTLPQTRDLKEVEGAILNASENLYQGEWTFEESVLPQDIKIIDEVLREYFGDALCIRQRRHQSRGNVQRRGKKMSEESKSCMKMSDHINEFSYPSWSGVGKTRTFPLVFKNISESQALQYASKKCIVNDIFEIPKDFRYKEISIEMNFAGGKPVPLRHLIRRRLDKNHCQFTVHSNYFEKCKQAGLFGAHMSSLKPIKQHFSSVGGIMACF